MNMQLNASAFAAAAGHQKELKTIPEIDADVCDLSKRSRVLMRLIEDFEEQIYQLTARGEINPILFEMTGFDLVAFQANELRVGLQALEDAMEEIAAAS